MYVQYDGQTAVFLSSIRCRTLRLRGRGGCAPAFVNHQAEEAVRSPDAPSFPGSMDTDVATRLWLTAELFLPLE